MWEVNKEEMDKETWNWIVWLAVVDTEDFGLDPSLDDIDNAQPLLVLYDCETTGLNIYTDHIIEIAAEVINSPVPSLFSSLVKTSRRIPLSGTVPTRQYSI